jgi:hypothetical protein
LFLRYFKFRAGAGTTDQTHRPGRARLHYAPDASDAPILTLPASYSVRADQTCLALFFFLRLGG